MEPLPPDVCQGFHRRSDVWLSLNCSLPFALSHVLKSLLLFVGSGFLIFVTTGLVALTAIVKRYRDRP
jgi:hypothetical protein